MIYPPHPPSLASCMDFPAIEQLGRSLWKSAGMRGAAVLIGAGFSRDAILTSADIPPPPLWQELADAMKRDLYPGREAAAPWDPLRLAEEYRSYFGPAALDAFVRHHIRDSSWKPSENHARLVGLPWADILTTNYDTLLERAARAGDIVYDAIRTAAEIAFAKAPRIIKLHGSLGANEQFVIAEEDFRTYPEERGAFVNLARQCFVENELLLLGFSGDDPNFLAWAGWVRDHLRGGARRIYLAGALNLSPAKRKYLESHNIAPIDVFDAVKELDPADRHSTATRLILDALQALKPPPLHEWRPASTPRSGKPATVDEISMLIDSWTNDRKSYPGWLICPQSARYTLRHNSDLPPIAVIEQLPADTVARLMREMCWRRDTALLPLYDPEVDLIMRFADPASSPFLDDEGRLAIALSLQHYADEEDIEPVFQANTEVVAMRGRLGSDAVAQSQYRQALRALRHMDFSSAWALAEQIAGDDPAWGLRRANVIAQCGFTERAAAVVSATLADLRDRERSDRSSIWIRSRLAWALFLQNSFGRLGTNFQRWPEGFRESRCDPWHEIERYKEELVEKQRKAAAQIERMRPNFEPGSYALPSRTILMGTGHFDLAVELTRFFELAGVPPRVPHVSLFVQQRVEVLQFGRAPKLDWYRRLVLAGLASDMPEFERDFSRVAMAVLEQKTVDQLLAELRLARDYWIARRTDSSSQDHIYAGERLAILIAIIARLSIRLDDNSAEALHLEMIDLWTSGQISDRRLAKPVAAVLDATMQTVSPTDRERMAIEDLKLPLVAHYDGPDPVDWLHHASFGAKKRGNGLRAIVATLIASAGQHGHMRSAAIGRLTFLHHRKLLTAGECQKFARVAWEQLDDETPPLPANTTIFPYFWASLPVPDRNVIQSVRGRIFRLPNDKVEQDKLYNILRSVRSSALKPNAREARALFDRIATLRFVKPDHDDIAAFFDTRLSGYNAVQSNRVAGACLSWAVAPYLVADDRTPARMTALIKFIDETDSLAGLAGLLGFVTRAEARKALEAHTRRGLLSLDGDEAAYAAEALLNWAELGPSAPHKVPELLIDQLISVIEVQQSPALWRLMSIAISLVEKGYLANDLRDRLDVKLADLFVQTNYDEVTLLSEAAGRISLIRKQAVRLANALRQAGSTNPAIENWLKVASSDPLPEVRHALSNDDD
jgi:hypothetical protein